MNCVNWDQKILFKQSNILQNAKTEAATQNYGKNVEIWDSELKTE